ncbi:MAG: diphthamide biosynthesis enzyme Dph2 [Candidatus Diapherotrites archaeon]
MVELEINLEEAKKFLKEKKAETAIVQIPEGLKHKTKEILEELTKECENVFMKMDPCYGACDLPLHDMKVLNADCVIHIGHSPIHKTEKILYLPLRYKLTEKELEENTEILVKELKKNNINDVSLVTNAQYISYLEKLTQKLEKNNIKTKINKGTSRLSTKGQVLGCNYTTIDNNAQAIVYFGDGYFHPIGIIFDTDKKVYALNPLTKKIEELSNKKDKLIRKRYAAIAKAKEAKSFGIIVSIKTGQRQKEKAIELKKQIEKSGKKAYLFEVDFVNENYFTGINVDCLVNTACNRIVIDDAENWKTLIINPTECLIAIGAKKWEEWQPDEFMH